MAGVEDEKWQSLRDHTRKRLLVDMIRASRPTKAGPRSAAANAGYMVLVLDARATRVLSSALRMYDVMEEGLALVESLEKKRQPFPELEVIYFIEPTAASIQRVCADFADAKKPTYADVHLFFTRHVEDADLLPIQRCKPLVSRVQTFTEVNVDFLAMESHAFHFDMNDATYALYNETGDGRDACKESIVDRLVTLCASLNEYPYVRYQSGNALSTEIANGFQEKINSFLKSNTNYWFRGDGQPGHGDQSLRGTLLVLDRSVDVAAPLVHEFTYQAMVYDVLDVQGDNRVDYKVEGEASQPDRTAHGLLNEHDALWCELRHMHMAEVIQDLSTHLQEFLSTSVGKMARGQGGDMDLAAMREAVKELPGYKDVMQKHTMHTYVASQCMDRLQQLKLMACADLEQLMVTGVNKDAHEVSTSALTMQLVNLMKDPSIGEEETLRLLAIYVVTQKGIKPEDRKRLVQGASPPLSLAAQQKIINLSRLGVTMQTGAKKQKTRRQKDLLEKAKRMALNCDYSVARYVPAVQEITESLCSHALEKEAYPYIFEPPPMSSTGTARNSGGVAKLSVRKHGLGPVKSLSKFGAKWGATKDKGAVDKGGASQRKQFDGARLIIFVAGGATYSELRAIHEVMKEHNREVIIGSTHFLKPGAFLSALGRLDREGAANAAAEVGGMGLSEIKLET